MLTFGRTIVVTFLLWYFAILALVGTWNQLSAVQRASDWIVVEARVQETLDCHGTYMMACYLTYDIDGHIYEVKVRQLTDGRWLAGDSGSIWVNPEDSTDIVVLDVAKGTAIMLMILALILGG
ncbi:MAG: hypothetical protein LBE83_04280 [Propionibacteriaceae bacterium]|jgi:hypothetical protein|nr:hypothetical protein [Propionibacteriaceae bacterium]